MPETPVPQAPRPRLAADAAVVALPWWAGGLWVSPTPTARPPTDINAETEPTPCRFSLGIYIGPPLGVRDRAASPAPTGICDLSCKHEINSLLIVLSFVQTVISMVNEEGLLCEMRRPAGPQARELLHISIMARCLLLAHLFNPTCTLRGRWDFEVSEKTKHKLNFAASTCCEETLPG